MIIFRMLFLIFFTFSCNSEPIREEINVGETIKIEASKFPTTNNTYIYKWTKPSGPRGNNSIYKVEKNKMLFTPDVEGKYDIILLIESFDQTLLYEEVFIYNAIDIGLKNNLNESDNTKTNSIEEDLLTDTTLENPIKDIKISSYTIQVASWPTMERAGKHQLELRNLGYDSYIEEFHIKEKAQTWWRVRVGHFIDKTKAEEVKKQISNKTGIELWIDFISE